VAADVIALCNRRAQRFNGSGAVHACNSLRKAVMIGLPQWFERLAN